MTGINDVNSCGSDAFSLKLNYETANTALDGSHLGCRNGNISSMEWRTGVGCSVNGVTRNKAIYGYFYDNKNRLVKAKYGEITGTTNIDNYTFEATYNDNGDILTSKSRGKNGVSFGLIDDLVYSMTSSGISRLSTVQDNGVTTLGFATSGPTYQSYGYDNNGNLTTRANTTFTTMEYNHLNLTSKYIGSGANLIENTYDASGRKWKTTQNGTETYYFGELQYTSNIPTIYHADGRIVSSAGTWEYNYYINDHLGNTRALVKGPAGGAVLMQENHYYPFGMGMDGNWVTQIGQNEKHRYNSKELIQNGLNLYDYGARNYDPSIGRFTTIDRYTESFSNNSPYIYTNNNPIKFIDVNGDWTNYGWNRQQQFRNRPHEKTDTKKDEENEEDEKESDEEEESEDSNSTMKTDSVPSPSDGANWFPNAVTVLGMTLKWVSGHEYAADHAYYNNHPVADAMRNAHGVNLIRDAFYKKYYKARNVQGAFYTSGIGKFGYPMGIIRAGIDPVEQFIGRYRVDVHVKGYKLEFTLWNKTSTTSFFYGLVPEKEGGIMRNYEQTYIFTEPIDFKKLGW